MKRSRVLVGLTATALVLPGSVAAAGATEVAPSGAKAWTEWVSDDGGSAGRELPAMSADGRYTVFVGRSRSFQGVWVKDRKFPGQPAVRIAKGTLFNPAISDNGKVIAWAQYGETQAVFAYDWQKPNAVPEMVSVSDSGAPAGQPSDFPSLSRDGRYVAFQSMNKELDSDAIAGKAGGGPNKVYVRDRVKKDTEMVSVVDVDGGDQIINGQGIKPDITPDGRFVAFASDASVLQGIETEETTETPTDGSTAAAEEEETTTYQQIYVRDRMKNTTLPVSVGIGSTADTPVFGDGASAPVYGPSISDNGMRVAFESDATNLVADDTNVDTDVFVRDMGNGRMTRVSVDQNGAQADLENPVVEEPTETPTTEPTEGKPTDPGGGDTTEDVTPNVGLGAVISGNGQYVAFESDAALTPDDVNTVEATCTDESGETTSGTVLMTDVYRYALSSGTLDRQSVADDAADTLAFEATGYRVDGHTGLCVPANNGVDPAISGDGSRVAFVSAGNLTGREVESEEGEDTVTDPAAEPVVPTSIEPNVYLHRPNPEPDIVAPSSRVVRPDATNDRLITVKYVATDDAFPSSGVSKVQLYVKRPGADSYRLVRTDRGAGIDRTFVLRSGGKNGIYRFYTVATDKQGNVEKAPRGADKRTRLDTVKPVITNVSISNRPFDMSSDHRTVFSMRVSEKSYTRMVVKHDGLVVKQYPTALSRRGVVTRTWAGSNDAGRRVHDGVYVVVMKARDLAGNTTRVAVPMWVSR